MSPSFISRVILFTLAAASLAHAGAQPLYHTLVQSDAPILWYRFDEPIGATEIINHGSLGATHNGKMFNGVTLEGDSIVGDGSATFNHLLDQYVQSIGNAPASLTGNPSFTAEAVVRINHNYVNNSTGWPPYLHWGSGITGKEVYFSLWQNSNNRSFVGFYNGGLRTIEPTPAGCFYHLVWVRDSNRGRNGQFAGSTLYVNGEVVALEPDSALPGAPVINVTSTPFRIQKANDFDRYFSGHVDEIVLYDTLLTAEQVQARAAALGLEINPCKADLTGDGTVDGADLGLLLGAWTTEGSGGCIEPPLADLTCDCIVDGADLGLLLGAWGDCNR